MPTGRQALTLAEWKVIGIAGICMAVVIAVMWIMSDFNADPRVTPPTLVMPVPNARDGFLKACRMLISSHTLFLAGQPHLPRRPTQAAIDADLRKDAPAFARLRASLGQAYGEPYSPSYFTVSSQHAGYRNMSRMLDLAAHAHISHSDWNGAMQYGLDGIAFNTTALHGADVTITSMKYAHIATACRTLWSVVPHLSGTTAKMAARRLESLLAHRPPVSAAIQREKWEIVLDLQAAMRKPGWRRERAQLIDLTGNSSLFSMLTCPS